MYWVFTAKPVSLNDGTHRTSKEVIEMRAKDNFWGIPEGATNYQKLEEGDKVLWYAGGLKAFVGIATLGSAAYSPSKERRIKLSHGHEEWQAQRGVDLEDINLWRFPKQAEELVPQLVFFSDKRRWWGKLQGAIHPISVTDYRIITEHGDSAPIRKFERRAARRARARPVQATMAPWLPAAVDPSDLAERRDRSLILAERRNQSHQVAVQGIDKWLKTLGFETDESYYDILARKPGRWLLIEVKSLGSADDRIQTIRAIGQLAWYAAQYVPRRPPKTVLTRVTAFDKPLSDLAACRVLQREGIEVIWIEGGEVKFLGHNFRRIVS